MAATAKTEKNTFQATNGKYKRQSKRDIRGEEGKEQKHLMEADLELLTEERSQLISENEKVKRRAKGEAENV